MSDKLVVVGGGKMGEALVSGLLAAEWAAPSDITVAETLASRREQLTAPGGLADRRPGLKVRASPAEADGAAGAVVAVKPGDVEAAARALAGAGVGRVLSIAAGVRLVRLQEWLGSGMPVVRAMPNTPALVGAGAAAIAPGDAAGEADLAWAESILGDRKSVV